MKYIDYFCGLNNSCGGWQKSGELLLHRNAGGQNTGNKNNLQIWSSTGISSISSRRENLALENILRQGYQCYLPVLPSEELCWDLLAVADEPLCPRYLFICLG